MTRICATIQPSSGIRIGITSKPSSSNGSSGTSMSFPSRSEALSCCSTSGGGKRRELCRDSRHQREPGESLSASRPASAPCAAGERSMKDNEQGDPWAWQSLESAMRRVLGAVARDRALAAAFERARDVRRGLKRIPERPAPRGFVWRLLSIPDARRVRESAQRPAPRPWLRLDALAVSRDTLFEDESKTENGG
jgi:hypothetical protein